MVMDTQSNPASMVNASDQNGVMKMTHAEFTRHFAEHLWCCLTQFERDSALHIAWLDCANDEVISDEVGILALDHAMDRVTAHPFDANYPGSHIYATFSF